jgi:hypothetical protein
MSGLNKKWAYDILEGDGEMAIVLLVAYKIADFLLDVPMEMNYPVPQWDWGPIASPL